jgi:hypothetical protein
VSSCSVYKGQGECEGDHCGWNGDVCVRDCFKYEDEQSCTNVNAKGCFWVEGDASKNIGGSCLIEVS